MLPAEHPDPDLLPPPVRWRAAVVMCCDVMRRRGWARVQPIHCTAKTKGNSFHAAAQLWRMLVPHCPASQRRQRRTVHFFKHLPTKPPPATADSAAQEAVHA